MKRLIFNYLVIILIIVPGWSYSQDFKMDVIDFMEKYEMYSSFTKDGLSFEKDYMRQFSMLFKKRNDKVVYNDIDSTESIFLSPTQYPIIAENKFKKGINVTIEIQELYPPKEIGANRFEIIVHARKHLFGLKEISNSESKIRNYEYNLVFLLEYSKNAREDKISIIKIYSPRDYQYFPGIHVGLCLQPTFSNIQSKDFQNSSNSLSGWEQNGGFVFNFGLEAKVYTSNPKINYGVRLMYSSYKTTIELSDFTQQDKLMSDGDNDTYFLLYEGRNIEEQINVRYLEIPVFYSYVHEFLNHRSINHIYANIGPSLGFQFSSAYDNSGVSTHEGYYPAYHVILYDIPQYGYYSNYAFNNSSEVSLNKFNISGYLEAGINLNIIQMLSVEAGLFANIGLLNLSQGNSNYLFSNGFDDYTSLIESRSNVKTRSYGLNISLKYKIK